ncbi:MAG: TorD/DmsD family molecular chaperone [Burkholderiaceae bacterium]
MNQAISVTPNRSAEELARADWYALIGALLLQAPSQELLGHIASAQAGDAQVPLGQAWNGLRAAAAKADASAVRFEFDSLFYGVGKSEVAPNASYYITGFLHDKPLVALRQLLAELGLERAPESTETEDHLGLLCETMRLLISSEEFRHNGYEAQRLLFTSYIAPMQSAFSAAVAQAPSAGFYRHVAAFAAAFFDVESEAFTLA